MSTERHAPSFSLTNKLVRVLWGITWLVFGRFTPPPLHRWRAFVLRCFGARLGPNVRIYGSAKIWLPANLEVGEGTLIGPRVRLYNQGRITIGRDVVISQDASLCASSHDVEDPAFPLILRPIRIGDQSWIAAETFVGPGVTVEEGAVLGARGCAMKDLESWTYYRGNPAIALKKRPVLDKNHRS